MKLTALSIDDLLGKELYQKALKLAYKQDDLFSIAFGLKSIGFVYYHQEKYSKCKEFLQKALNTYEKLNNMVEQAIIVNTYGVLYYKQGEYEKAFLEYQKAMKLNPEDPNPYFNLACVSSITNKPDIALEYLKKAIKLNPSYKEMISKERDLDNLRNLEEFRKLIPD